MTAAILIPVTGPITEVQVTDGTIGQSIGAEYFELVSNRHDGYGIAVHDEGLLIGLPVNGRATLLARTFGRAYGFPLVGDALVLGFDEGGETVDVPAQVAAALAGQQ